ncbi:hypothetical protein M569_03135 [Genlisea aurea]|uniref:Transcriptional coactivator Hfi1/Transcriptional adapter 1 n=1 Tax=Genlisea aurea TaxID=192259 RepID=S8CXF1_9LAMI|nr:hypothetical protein M569_03135 [Genlisea aurea]
MGTTLELKHLIYRKVGLQRADKYFDQLKRFISSKLTKHEFSKTCLQILGRENIPLHNRLIHSILRNSLLEAKRQRNFLRKGKPPPPLVTRDRKSSPLGPLGKTFSLTHDETISRIQEQSGGAELHSICSRPPIAVVEEGEEVEQISLENRWSCVTAPLGIDARQQHQSCLFPKTAPASLETCRWSGVLPDSTSLRQRLEKKLESEGVCVSVECADVLNKGLEAFMKRLLKCCSTTTMGGSSTQMLDFCIAVETNRSILGENWAAVFEKMMMMSPPA